MNQQSAISNQQSAISNQRDAMKRAQRTQRSTGVGYRLKWRARLAHYPAPIRMLGFTLIELSIVLVIIGLIVGGLLVGQDLIQAANTRAGISQIEKYNTAVYTFRNKYGSLPGDMGTTKAASLGFATRASGVEQKEDRLILRNSTGAANETVLFWQDLLVANLIADNLVAIPDATVSYASYYADPLFAEPMFKGKSNSYIRMNSLDPLQRANLGNYYTVFGYKDPNLWAGFTGAISPIQAFNIDSKIDDAKPLSGKVRAFGPNSAPLYVGYNPGGGLALPASEPWSAAGTYLRYCIDGNGINGDADDPYYVDDSNQTQLGCMLSISAPF